MPSSLRLSTAIRLGAILMPQGFFSYLTLDGKSCALGAAGSAVGMTRTSNEDDIFTFFPILETDNKMTYSDLYRTIVYQNDTLKVSREAIADLVQKEEEKYYLSHPDPENWSGKPLTEVTETTQTLGLQSSKEEVTLIIGEAVNDRN